MHEFKDTTGDKWQIALTWGVVRVVQRESDGRFNLSQLGSLAETLDSDFLEFYDLLWLLVKPQAEAKGVSESQFGERIAADVIHGAREAFFAEWVDFFHLLHRPDQARAVEFIAKNTKKALQLLKAKVEAESPLYSKLEARAEFLMSEAFETSFSALRESLATLSTPGVPAGETSTVGQPESTEQPAS